ncbi:MFS general substrate transporter [Westerdykella ornata]|uniref:MFS general substrate transporter n=1 Tax=Westerdykella ornata TaxID=318751 RepID=A0A6A6JRH5_WESOR|nr:MFS general substrate transporter [Westerdykella ornata]KAF2278874.1 MFS general substrate transporter [Westerdykella ornata]
MGSPFCGILVDKIGPNIPLCVGSLGLELALFMTSLCTQYWQLMLAQALLLGLSMSLVCCPPLGVVSRHMPHRRGLALGLTIGGSSIGGVIWPIMMQQLLVHHGISFGWTMRAVAFKMSPLLAFACLTVVEPLEQPSRAPSGTAHVTSHVTQQQPIEEAEQKKMEDAAADGESKKADLSFLWKPTYILLCLGLAVIYFGLFTPLFYVSAYAIDKGQSLSTAFYLLSAVNASSFFGRVGPGHFADTYGHYNLLIIFTLLSGIVGFTWTRATSLGGMIVWSLAYGFTSGAVMSLQNACAGKIAPLRSQGAAVGFLMGCLSITALIGVPIGGQILKHSGYPALSMWTGATIVVGAAVLGVARFTLDPHLFAVF